MTSEWINRRKAQASAEAQDADLQRRRVDTLKGKAPDWMRRLGDSLERQVQEVRVELGQQIEFRKQNDISFAFHTHLVYPAITTMFELDLAAQTIVVRIIRTKNAQSGAKEERHPAALTLTPRDEVVATFFDHEYLQPEHFAAHVLEFALYGQHPPREPVIA